jgi:hypothetical protein
VGGNLIEYPYELTTRTADLTTSKILWNSVISTPGARFAAADIKNFYLNTPLDRYEYMRMPLKLTPQPFIDQYDLQAQAKMDMFTSKSKRVCMGSHKPES